MKNKLELIKKANVKNSTSLLSALKNEENKWELLKLKTQAINLYG